MARHSVLQLMIGAVFFTASMVSAQDCSIQQGPCLYFYDSINTAGTCPIGIVASFYCDGQVPADSTVDIRWYWTQNEDEAGTLGTLIEMSHRHRIINPVPGHVTFSSTLQVHNFTDTDSGFYWCQMVINGSRLLEPSCPMNITALQTNGTSNTDVCMVTGTNIPRQCADFIVITETSQFNTPTPSVPTTIMSDSSLLPESPSALPGTTALSGMESSSKEPITSGIPVPMDTSTSSSLSSAVYGALGAAAVVVFLVGCVVVSLLVCVYLLRRKKLKGKAKTSSQKNNSSSALKSLGDYYSEPAVAGEYTVVQMKEVRDASADTHPLQHGPSSYDKKHGVPSEGEPILGAVQLDGIHNPSRPDTIAAHVNNSVPEQHETNPDIGIPPQAKTLTPKGNHRQVQTGSMNNTTEANLGQYGQQESLEENTDHVYEPIPDQHRGRQLAPAATRKQTPHFHDTVGQDPGRFGEFTHTANGASTLRATNEPRSEQSPSNPHLYHVLEGAARGNPEDEEEVGEDHYYSTVRTYQKGRLPTRKVNTNGDGYLNEATTPSLFDDPEYDVSPQPSRRTGVARAVEANVPPKTAMSLPYHTLEGPAPVEKDNEYDYCRPQDVLKSRVKTTVTDKSERQPMGPVRAGPQVPSGPPVPSGSQVPSVGIQTTMTFENPLYQSTLTGKEDRGQGAQERGKTEDVDEREEDHYYSTVVTGQKGLLPTRKGSANGEGSLNEMATQPSFDDPAYGVSPSHRTGVETSVPLKKGAPDFYHTLEGPTSGPNDNEYDYCTPQALLKPHMKAAVTDKSSTGPPIGEATAQVPCAGIQRIMTHDTPQRQSSSLNTSDDRGPGASGSDCTVLFDDSMYAVTTRGQEWDSGTQGPESSVFDAL